MQSVPTRSPLTPFGVHLIVSTVGSPLRRSMRPVSGPTVKLGCESAVQPQ